MSSLNKVMLAGRLYRDPEMRYTPSGQPVTTLTVTTERSWTPADGGEAKRFTDYHTVVVWNQGRRALAEEVAQRGRKGSAILVEGRLQTRSWDGPDGRKQRATEVVATDVQVDAPPAAAPSSHAASEAGEPVGAGAVRDVDPDDIPF